MNDTTSAAPRLLPSARSVAHTRHGHSSRERNFGAKDSPTYRSWLAMRARCNLDGRENSDRYREKGVSYDARWDSFDSFLRDMGERPPGKTLDRWPDRDGNYGPSNCRWATPAEQARNTRRNVLTFDAAVEVALRRLKGERCKDIAEKFGISESLPREIVKGRCWKDALAKAKELLCMSH